MNCFVNHNFVCYIINYRNDISMLGLFGLLVLERAMWIGRNYVVDLN